MFWSYFSKRFPVLWLWVWFLSIKVNVCKGWSLHTQYSLLRSHKSLDKHHWEILHIYLLSHSQQRLWCRHWLWDKLSTVYWASLCHWWDWWGTSSVCWSSILTDTRKLRDFSMATSQYWLGQTLSGSSQTSSSGIFIHLICYMFMYNIFISINFIEGSETVASLSLYQIINIKHSIQK